MISYKRLSGDKPDLVAYLPRIHVFNEGGTVGAGDCRTWGAEVEASFVVDE